MWGAGDVHVHSSGASNDTDGVSFPEDIAAMARARGLGFVVLTDHSNATGSMDCDDVEDCPNLGPEFPWQAEVAALSDETFVMVDGDEISPIETLTGIGGPVGHIGCLPPADGFTWQGAFTDRPPGEVTGADAAQQCREIGGLAVINHPFAAAPWITFDWSTLEFDAIEVWNGGMRWDRWDRRGVVAWECLVSQGRSVQPIAASDNHRVGLIPPGDALNPPLGQPRTSVRLPSAEAEALSWPAIRAALESGPVVLHEAGSFVTATPEVDGTAVTWRASGTAVGAAIVELRRIPPGASCDPALAQESAPLSELVGAASVEGAFDVALSPPVDQSALVYLRLTRLDLEDSMEGDVAMTSILTP